LVIISAVLLVIRPREWPAFFDVGFLDNFEFLLQNDQMIPLLENYLLNQRSNSPLAISSTLVTTVISEKLMKQMTFRYQNNNSNGL
jgi:hypothetical protein